MNDASSRNYRGAFVLLTLLFFMWGFITVMNDVLIGAFKGIFQLTTFESSLVQAAFFGAFFVLSLIYFLISSRWGDPINRIGYKNGMVVGLLVCGMGCGLFYPAAQLASYGFFLFALFVLAGGVTILQIAANPYAAILGSPETSSSRLNLSQGFNSLGTTIGPLVGIFLIYRIFFQAESGSQQPSPDAVGSTYLLYGLVFVACAVLVMLRKMPAFRNEEKIESGVGALKFSNLRLGILAIFMYVGAEVACGSFLVQFLGEPDVAGMPAESANKFLAYFWGGLMIGRLIGAISLGNMNNGGKKFGWMALVSIGTFLFIYLITSIDTSGGQFRWEGLAFREVALFLGLLILNLGAFMLGRSYAARTVVIFSVAIILLLLLAVFGKGEWAFWALIGTGLFHSIMWSNIFTLAIKGLGKYTSQGSSLLIMAIVGGAFIPPLQGWVADYLQDTQLSYLVPALCYIYIAYFGQTMLQTDEKS